MGIAILPFIVFTVLWGGVGILLPIFVPKGPNKGIIQVILILTGVCCWLFWLCCYVAQMNPLIGPKLDKHTIMVMAKAWNILFEKEFLVSNITFISLIASTFIVSLLRL